MNGLLSAVFIHGGSCGCCLALASGVRELLIEHRITLTEVLREVGKGRLLLQQIGIDHLPVGQVVCNGPIDLFQRQHGKGLGQAFCSVPLSKSIDEGIEGHAGTRDP